jgi:asparagine synthase (glutamine-hydrolysing)
MARIAGVVDGNSGAAEGIAAAMLGLMTSAQATTRSVRGGAFAGADRNLSVAGEAGCTAIVDGVFYNADAIAGDAQDAALQLIHEYRRHGFAGALARINGDFAAALHDAEKGTLWLGRDRVGVKPMYYAQGAGSFAFSSRPQPLRALDWVSKGINRRYVAVFAGSHYRYIDNEPGESPFEGIAQLPAGHCLQWSGGSVSLNRYWNLAEADEWNDSETALAERYRALLLDAVGKRLGGAQRPIFTLSGGMDSSSVLACAAQVSGRRQQAVSTVYTDKTYDESEDIRGFVAEKVEKWQPISVEGFDLFDTVAQMVRAHDEPVATATWLSHFILTQQIGAQGHDVLFGGLGGDELNAGEYEYFVFNFADLRAGGLTADLAHEIECWAKHHDHPIYRKNRDAAESHLSRLAGATRGEVLVDRERLTHYYPAVNRSFFALDSFSPVLDHPFESWLKNRTYQDIFRETAPCCLRAEDRNCEAAGLAHADPFFDYRLIEFMFRVPGSMKIRDGVTKRLLREAMRGVLPEETRTRVKKTGWNAPAHLWFSGKTLDQLQDLVSSQAFRERGIYNVDEVSRIIAEHRDIVGTGAVRENHMMFLWQLLNVEMWAREVVDRVPELAKIP